MQIGDDVLEDIEQLPELYPARAIGGSRADVLTVGTEPAYRPDAQFCNVLRHQARLALSRTTVARYEKSKIVLGTLEEEARWNNNSSFDFFYGVPLGARKESSMKSDYYTTVSSRFEYR